MEREPSEMARQSRGPFWRPERPSEPPSGGSEDDLELPPFVMPEEEDDIGGPGPGRLALWILAGALLAGLAFWPLGILDLPVIDGTDAASPPNTLGHEPAPPRFETLLDSLESSVSVLRQRHEDHERGRITCEDLVPAYRRLDDLVVALAIARSEAGSLDPETESSYEELMARAEAEERRFDRTGCPRP